MVEMIARVADGPHAQGQQSLIQSEMVMSHLAEHGDVFYGLVMSCII
jgi:hypothetical protein